MSNFYPFRSSYIIRIQCAYCQKEHLFYSQEEAFHSDSGLAKETLVCSCGSVVVNKLIGGDLHTITYSPAACRERAKPVFELYWKTQ